MKKNDVFSERLKKLPPYLFAEIDNIKEELKRKGQNLISLGVGDPDIPTPKPIVEVMKKSLDNPEYHQYPFGRGLKKFRDAVSFWYKKRFNVKLDPETEIHSLIGSKEGIGHLPLGIVNRGDIVLIPEPSYPVYFGGTIFADGKPYFLPLRRENNFLPDLKKVPSDILKKTKLLFLNYPNNPTSALVPKNFYEEVVKFAKKYKFFVASDIAYSEIYFGKKPLSFLSVKGAKDIGIEFHSLSKTFNMTGWRIGWVCGNRNLISALKEVKDNFDSGVFMPIQEAGTFALLKGEKLAEKNRLIWKKRRDFFYKNIKKLGFEVFKPEATFYIWARVPKGYTSEQVAKKILIEAKVIVTPGSGFGKSGEGYIRFALTASIGILKEAISRISKIKW